jgi:hypothetical protein
VPLRKEQARSRHKLHKRQTPARSAPPHVTGSIIWVDAQGRCLSAREIAESRTPVRYFRAGSAIFGDSFR